MATIDVTEENFEQTVTGEGITLVDAWADWCGPCKRFAPVYEKASEEHPDATFAKLDTDANPQITARYGITSIPTMHVFKDGEIVKTLVGAMPKPKLVKEIEPFVG